MDLEKNCIKVMGNGDKEGYLIFGEVTKMHTLRHLEENSPASTLFDLDTEGLKTMLRRLQVRTGIKCNAHSFRRRFATELRRKGLSELDIAELGRWSSTEMVQRYSKAYTFQDAAIRYKAIVRKEEDISLYPQFYLIPHGTPSHWIASYGPRMPVERHYNP